MKSRIKIVSRFAVASLLPLFFASASFGGFVNGGFESPFTNDSTAHSPITGWTQIGYKFNGNASAPNFPPTSISVIPLTVNSGSTPGAISDVIIGTNQSLVDYFLFGATPSTGSSPIFLLPFTGSQSAIINLKSTHTPLNKSGTAGTPSGFATTGQQATELDQTITLQSSDVDPVDGKVHIRFLAAPVLENPSHAPNQQPFVAIELDNITTGRTGANPLFFQWNYGGQPGASWNTLSSAGSNSGTNVDYQYQVYNAFDIAPGNAYLHVGDQITLRLLASGCSPGGHDGHMYVDDVAVTIPPNLLWISATGPTSAAPGSNITYTYTYTNTEALAVSGVQIVANMPVQANGTLQPTTFVSITTPTAGTSPSCSGNSVGGTAPETCTIGTLQPGESGSFQYTVNIPSGWATLTGPVNNGNYTISNPLLNGPLVQTTLVAASGLSNLVASTSGLPTTATVGTSYSGTFTCTNTPTATATGSAPNASCDITNLPAGLSTTGCVATNPSNAWTDPTAILSSQVVTCTVSGTPTTGGSFTSTVTTNATNNSNSTTNTANVTINIPITITPTGDGNEVISPSSQTLNSGNTTTFTVTPTGGYTLLTPGGTCPAGSFSGNVYTTGVITTSCTLSFSASTTPVQVTPTGDGNETISPSSVQTIASGTTKAFTVTANAGYTLGTPGGTCPAGSFSGSTYTTGTITSNCAVTFSATPNTYQVTPVSDGHETFSPNTAQTVSFGGTQAFTVTANAGYTLGATTGGSCPAGSFSGNTYTTGAITGDCTVTFNATLTTYQVTPSGDGNETVSPSTVQTVILGTTKAFTLTANSGYTLGTPGGTCPLGSFSGNTYTTGAITSNCSVTFNATGSATPSSNGNVGVVQSPGPGGTQVFTLTVNPGYTVSSIVGGTCPAGSFSGNVYTTGVITSSCTVIFNTTANIPATVGGSPVYDPATVCCGRPVLLGDLPTPGSGPTTYAVTTITGDVKCFIGHSGSQTYLKVNGSKGSCTIIGTKNGISSTPFTVTTP